MAAIILSFSVRSTVKKSCSEFQRVRPQQLFLTISLGSWDRITFHLCCPLRSPDILCRVPSLRKEVVTEEVHHSFARRESRGKEGDETQYLRPLARASVSRQSVTAESSSSHIPLTILNRILSPLHKLPPPETNLTSRDRRWCWRTKESLSFPSLPSKCPAS